MTDGRGKHGNHKTGEKKERILIKCESCSKEMKFLACFLKIHPQRFCSKKCEGLSRVLDRVLVKCSQCDSDIMKLPSRVKKNNFCNRSCMGKFKSNEMAFWNDKEKIKQYHKIYRHHNRFVLKNGASENTFSLKDWNGLVEKFGSKCMKCGDENNITVDHIKSIDKGGENNINNIQILCKKCNSSKGTKEIDYRPSRIWNN